MSEPLRIAFLGCGFITRVHSRILTALRRDVVCSYASRDRARAEAYARQFGGARTYPFDDPVSSVIQLQAKTVLFPRADGDWSFGAVAAGARDMEASHGRTAFQAFNVTGLASWYPRDELEIDLNLGVAYLYGPGSFAVAGVAIQYAPIDALQLLGEVFRDEPVAPSSS